MGTFIANYVAFAVGAAALFGAGPILSKRGLSVGGSWIENTLLVVGIRTALFWAALIATGRTGALFGELSTAALVAFAAGGVAASGGGRLLWYIGIDRVGSSVSSAVTNVRPLFAVGLAAVWLGEAVTPRMWLGVGLLVVGLTVLSLSEGGDIAGWSGLDLVFPVVAAAGFAVANVVRRWGFSLEPAGLLPALTVGETVALAVVSGYAAASGRLERTRAPRRAYLLFGVAGVNAAVGIALLFAALRAGPVSVVDPLVATGPLFTVALAALFLRDVERITRGVVAGSAVVVLGAALVT